MPFNISNVIGAPFPEFVRTQIATRAVKNSIMERPRTLDEVLFIGNKTAWVRLQSSVAVSGSYDQTSNTFQSRVYDLLANQDSTGEAWWNNDWSTSESSLASKWVLQAGTSQYNQTPSIKPALDASGNPINDKNGNPTTVEDQGDLQLRSGIGLDGAYGLGGIVEQGYRPMPGLTNVKVETKGKLGSLRYATISFKVWNMNQLDVIDTLYFRLGYTMLLEWGHTQYFPNNLDTRLERNVSGIANYYAEDVTKDDINDAINQKIFETNGNYDGMLGVVTNFTYSYNQEGGWDCTVKIIGMGSLFETQRITGNYKMPAGVALLFDQAAAALVDKAREDQYKKELDDYNAKVQQATIAAASTNSAFTKANPVLKIEDIYKTATNRDAQLQRETRISLITYDNLAVRGGPWAPPTSSGGALKFTISTTNNKINLIEDIPIDQTSAANNNKPGTTNIVNVGAPYDSTNANLVNYGLFVDDDPGSQNKGQIFIPRFGQKGFVNAMRENSTKLKISVGAVKKVAANAVVPVIKTTGVIRRYTKASTSPGGSTGRATVQVYEVGTKTSELAPSRAYLNGWSAQVFEGTTFDRAVNTAAASAGTKNLYNYTSTSDFAALWGLALTSQGADIASPGIFKVAAIGSRDYLLSHLEPVAGGSISAKVPFPASYGSPVIYNSQGTAGISVDIKPFYFVGSIGQILNDKGGIITDADYRITTQTYAEITSKLIDKLNRTTVSDMYFSVTKVDTTSIPGTILYSAIQSADFKDAEAGESTGFKIDGPFNIQDSKGANLVVPSVTVRISFTTNIFSIISDILNVGVTQGLVDPTAGLKKPVKRTGAYTDDELAQIKKSGGLESAIEAMLTIIQYTTLVDHKDKNQAKDYSTVDVTGRMLTETANTLFAKFFKEVTIAATTKKGKPKKVFEVDTDFLKTKLSITDTPKRLTDPVSLGIKGFNTSLLSNQASPDDREAGFDNCYPKDENEAKTMLEDMCKAWCIPYTSTNSNTSDLAASLERPVYIKLGYLLFFINNFCLLYDTTKNKNPKNGKTALPFFYVDYNPETNLCFTMRHQLTVDPLKCLIPFTGNQDDYKTIFTTVTPTSLPAIFDGKTDKQKIVRTLWDPQKGDQNTISKLIEGFGTDSDFAGKTMHILLNVQYLLRVLKSSTQSDGHGGVYLKPFLDTILRDVNKAMGDMNAFRAVYSDPSNTVMIRDDQYVTPPSGEDNVIHDAAAIVQAINAQISEKGNIIIPVTGRLSAIRDFSFETNVSTKMSSLIAIGAGAGKAAAQGVDASGLKSLSKGLYDRVITERNEVSPDPADVQTSSDGNNNETLVIKFNDHVKKVYGCCKSKLDADGVSTAQNYLITNSANVKAGNPSTNANPVIPLNVQFTMDGISGIAMGNAFLLPNEIMPITVRGSGALTDFGFVVVKLDHVIDNNQWLTTIGGQMIRLKDTIHANKGLQQAPTAIFLSGSSTDDDTDLNGTAPDISIAGTKASDFLVKDASGNVITYNNFITAAKQSIGTITRDIPNTNNGRWGCGAGASIIYLRATGHDCEYDTRTNKCTKKVGISLGTASISSYMKKDSQNWRARADWRDAQPGDCIVTVTVGTIVNGKEVHGHIGWVVDTKNNDGNTWDIVSNSSTGYTGTKTDPKKAGTIQNNYSVKKWSSIANKKGVGPTYAYEFIGTFGVTI